MDPTVAAAAEEIAARAERELEALVGISTPSGDVAGAEEAVAICTALLSTRPELFAEVAVLLVNDEEWRTAEFAHVQRFSGYDACLCFEAGERAPGGAEAVIVRRKAAGTLRITAAGQASHSGSAPDQGRNALLALARAALAVSELHDPGGPDRRSVVPTVMRSGQAFNVVPAAGELVFDIRADRLAAFDPVLAAVPRIHDGVALAPSLLRRWPGMDTRSATKALIEHAQQRIGRPLEGVGRGGASDASHLAATIPLTIDGLGPRGGGAHTPAEFVLAPSLRERAEVAVAIALEALRG
jgi:glutamate carboxypeptidase